MEATLYRTDGTKETITPQNGTDFKLAELYAHLDCNMIELIDTGDPNMIMIGDEEAKCSDEFIINQEATRIYREGHGFVGDVRAIKDAETKRLKEQFGDIIINLAEWDESEPYSLAGNIIYCSSVMLK